MLKKPLVFYDDTKAQEELRVNDTIINRTGSILIELYSGGSDLTVGIKDTPVIIPYNGVVTGWQILAYNSTNTLVSTSCVVDVLTKSFATLPMSGSDTITGTEKPNLVAQSKNTDSGVITWSQLTKDFYLQAEIESISSGVAKIVVAIKTLKL